MQQAKVVVRTKRKSTFSRERNRMVPGESKEEEVIRSAWCGVKTSKVVPHDTSSDFRGVNESGWIFFCRDGCNMFLASPADEEA